MRVLIVVPALILLTACASSNPKRVNLDPRLLQQAERPLLRLVPDTMTNRDGWRVAVESDEQIRNCNQNLDNIRKAVFDRK